MTDVFALSAKENAARVLSGFISRPLRTMRQFAEEEIIVPDGPYAGRRFKVERQPFTGLLFDAIDSGKWNRFVITGPTQSGKTLSAWVIPVMYHLFEIGEKVIISAPKVETLADKWNEDLRPAIEASRSFREFLPKKGQGSRDAAKLDTIRFQNGAVLKLMGGGGSDKNRAAYTARVVVITETDGMDEAGGASREADKITQLEHRTDAYGERKRIYMECTVSIEEGRTWREYQNGTASKILLPCPKCGAWVTPEREHLAGWREAASAPEARQGARFECPECAEPWTEAERSEANKQCQLIHRGQELTPDGEIVGTPALTETLGFRWSAVNNSFRTAGDAGVAEWNGARSTDEENAEKELRQFIWAVPYDPPRVSAADINEQSVMERQGVLRSGFVPDDRLCVTMGVDVGKYRLHWTAVAWLPDGGGRIIGYDTVEVASASMVEQRAILAALRELRDFAEQGWTTPQGELVPVSRAWIDAHWNTQVVKQFCDEAGSKWWPSVGFGHGQYYGGAKTGRYAQPTNPTGKSSVKSLSLDRYHATIIKGDKVRTWLFDADHWKTELHKRLGCVAEDPASILLFKVENQLDHLSFARHITAEKQVEEFVPGEGTVIKWDKKRSQNHWLDASVLALLAGHSAGYARPTESPELSQPVAPTKRESDSGFVRKLNLREGSFVRRRS